MDIEQLKLILEMVGVAGGGAKDLALLWFALAFFQSLIGWAFGFFCVYFLWRVFKMVLECCTFLSELGNFVGENAFEGRGRRLIKEAVKRGTNAQKI